jgi:hypothetical protein
MTVDARAWTHLNFLEKGGFPALLWGTLKDFGYAAYPEYSTRELMSTKAALEALTTFCEKHTDLVASTTTKVIPLLKPHSGHGIEREAFLSAQGNHHSPELDTSVRSYV